MFQHFHPSGEVHIGNNRGKIALWLDKQDAIAVQACFPYPDLAWDEMEEAIKKAYPVKYIGKCPSGEHDLISVEECSKRFGHSSMEYSCAQCSCYCGDEAEELKCENPGSDNCGNGGCWQC